MRYRNYTQVQRVSYKVLDNRFELIKGFTRAACTSDRISRSRWTCAYCAHDRAASLEDCPGCGAPRPAMDEWISR